MEIKVTTKYEVGDVVYKLVGVELHEIKIEKISVFVDGNGIKNVSYWFDKHHRGYCSDTVREEEIFSSLKEAREAIHVKDNEIE